MYKVRLRYAKTGPAAYISHLDLMKCLQRAFRRARLPVRYSQGFNPHIYLSILAPLSTGFECLGDLCDFDLLEPVDPEQVVARLNATLPVGLKAIEAGEPVGKPGGIAFARYRIQYPEGDHQAMAALFAGPVQIEKKSKRGSRPVELGDYIASIDFERDGESVCCRAVLKAGDDPLNPVYITRALIDVGLLPEGCAPLYLREALLDETHQVFS